MRSRPGLCFAILVLSLTLVAPAAAQQQLGGIQGTITDQTGGVLPGVTLTVTNLATGVSRTTRNAFRGPGYKSVDLSLFKNVEFAGFGRQRSTNQIRVEAFNAFNWVNLNKSDGQHEQCELRPRDR